MYLERYYGRGTGRPGEDTARRSRFLLGRGHGGGNIT